jgi:hypothetical protein
MVPQFNILVVALFVGTVAVYGLIRWIQSAQVRPDPWESELAQQPDEMAENAICPRCLAPNATGQDFCANCGLPVGACTNLSPYLYLFSLGDALRTGAFGRFPIRLSTIFGYLLLPICVFAPLAPFFWYRLLQNISRADSEPAQAPA